MTRKPREAEERDVTLQWQGKGDRRDQGGRVGREGRSKKEYEVRLAGEGDRRVDGS